MNRRLELEKRWNEIRRIQDDVAFLDARDAFVRDNPDVEDYAFFNDLKDVAERLLRRMAGQLSRQDITGS
jgi:hypothetical protein